MNRSIACLTPGYETPAWVVHSLPRDASLSRYPSSASSCVVLRNYWGQQELNLYARERLVSASSPMLSRLSGCHAVVLPMTAFAPLEAPPVIAA